MIFALISGAIFGFLLQRARVCSFDTIIGQLTLKDFTVMKVMLTAMTVGAIGIYLCNNFGWVPTFHLSKTPLYACALGGGIFGVGMSLAGYCPGTAVAALANGSKDMFSGFIGMLLGAYIFHLVSPSLPFLSAKDAFYQQTIPSYLDISPWIVIPCLITLLITFAYTVHKIELKQLYKHTTNA